eukprot:CAMPEP_0195510238 /NCGR_PEP_ID=MMETSP0794_2-20130614/2940_1 /TAXON_ID=515487 /ORGANISM="Stephanopyxis turris, Strain CCMP 815" /LENGTH=199 /DNA_ID=CAMNT_0040637617 /DNA_START=44 /DNA_END=646 /DNA_ORIENTATION=-
MGLSIFVPSRHSLRITLLLVSLAFTQTHGFSLIDVKAAKIPADIDGIRECRQTSVTNKAAPLLDSQKSFLNANNAINNSKEVVCIIAKEKLYPWRVLGTADVRINAESNKAYINNVYVRGEARNKGIGRMLMIGAEEQVRRRRSSSGSELSLEVETQNGAAVSLYRRCGYDTPGIHSFASFVGENAGVNLSIIMTKNLE